MADKVSITFHSVTACGYYKYAEPVPEFGTQSGLLAELKKWSVGKSLGNTQITNPAGGNILPVYLYGIEPHATGAYLVTMWNEIPATSDNKVASVAANDTVGSVVQYMNDVKKGTIPGFPTFFLFLPGVDAFATLRIDGLVTAQPAFQGYCEQFLTTQASFVVKMPPDPKDPNADITFGYRADAKDDPNPKLYPRFRTKIFTKAAITDEIIKRWDDIRQVQRKAKITFKTAEQKDAWQKILGATKMNAPAAQPRTARIESSLSVRLTQAEVKTLIADWGKQAQNTDWDDYGFRFKGEHNFNYLSQSTARGEVNLDGIRSADGTINAKDLLDKIMKHQAFLLKLMQ